MSSSELEETDSEEEADSDHGLDGLEEQVWVVGFWLLRRILVRLTTICHDFAQFRIMVSHQATPKEEREKTKEERAIADVSLLL